MKLLLDQGLPRSAAELLSSTSVDTAHVWDIGMATAEDEAILAAARKQQRVVVTLDADFHALLALSGAKDPSVIRIRIEGLRAEPLCKLLLDVLAKCRADLEAGALITVRRTRIRVKRLPVK